MTLEQLAGIIGENTIGLIGKIFFLVIIFIYAIFAAIVFRQIQIMNKVVTEVGFSPLLLSVAFLHLIAVVVLFLLVLLLI